MAGGIAMRKAAGLLCFVMVMLYGSMVMAATVVSSDGYYKGIKLCGKVRVVEHFAG